MTNGIDFKKIAQLNATLCRGSLCSVIDTYSLLHHILKILLVKKIRFVFLLTVLNRGAWLKFVGPPCSTVQVLCDLFVFLKKTWIRVGIVQFVSISCFIWTLISAVIYINMDLKSESLNFKFMLETQHCLKRVLIRYFSLSETCRI